ncbi:MAG: sporulation protein YabP [Clostridiales bacterium]|jgi:sporulation protein YabP|nr:sporulation protein YabP [Clostridiales bacterium]
MVFEEKYKKTEVPSAIALNARRKLTVTGVEDVESFDENTIVLYTTGGLLIVRGQGLHIEKLSIDGGELSVEGTVDSMSYEEESGKQGGFWARLFK